MPVQLRMIDGRATAVKTRPGPDGPAALAAELSLLRSLDLPGVVRLASEALTDEPALLLDGSGTSTLATTTPDPEQVRMIGRHLLETVRALHESGIAHDAIEPSHVLWAPNREPVLCGFGAATSDGDQDADIEALAEMLADLLPEGDPLRAELARVDGDLARLDAALTQSARPPSGPRLPAPDRPASDPAGRRRLVITSGAAALGLVVLVVVALLAGPFGGQAPSTNTVAEPPPTEPLPTTTSAVPEPTRSDPLVWPEPANEAIACNSRSGTLGSADVDGDGCTEPIDRDGDVVSAGARRWRVGETGDHVALGDWWCSGSTTLALVTATSGDVHVFSGWPTDEPATVPATTTVGPASGVQVAAADGCDVLVIELADGSVREVTP
ncbi:MAG: hypothetical protein AAGA99_01835 [Actinomycetota bacterium]